MSKPTLQQIMKEFIDKELMKERLYTSIGTATDVDEVERKCNFTPIGDEGGQFDVRLQSAFAGELGVVMIPKEGSIIGVSFLNPTAGFVTLTSELEKILIDTELTQFNGGDNGGLINIEDAVTKWNNIESDLNTLKGIFGSWVPAPNDGGAALKALLSNYISDTLTPTTQSELEDKKVLH